MKTAFENAPKRFKDAVMKLYNAYHNNELELTECTRCAVGNICDNNGSWFLPIRRTNNLYHMKRNPMKETDICNMPKEILDYGYSAYELAMIEHNFAVGIGAFENKETQFKGLCLVIEYLCELDNIENPMDFTKLFETENEKPKYELV